MSNKRLCNTAEEVKVLLRCLKEGTGPIGFDTEVSGPLLIGEDMVNVYSSTLTGFSVSIDHVCWYVPLRHRRGRNLTELCWWPLLLEIARSSRTVWAHNWKFDLQVMYTEDRAIGLAYEKADLRCSMLAAWLMQHGSYSLKAIAKEVLGVSVQSFEEVAKGRSFDDLSPEEAMEYACNDAIWAVQIGQYFEERMKIFDPKLYDTFLTLEMPLCRVLRHMEATGVVLDAEELQKQQRVLQPIRERLYEEFYWLTGGCEPGSSAQIGKWAYDGGHWSTEDIPKGKSGKYSTNADSVEVAFNRCRPGTDGHSAAKLLLEYRGVDKLLSTYTSSLIDNAAQFRDGRLHSNYLQWGTATGRLSSSGPNLQNIPVRSDYGKLIQKAFVAPEGQLLVSADYSQIELRVLAHLAGDGKFLEAYKRNEDIHQQTGDIAGTTRGRGKTMNFAIVFGAQDKKLAKMLGSTREEAKYFLKNYGEGYPEVARLRTDVIDAGKRRGYVRTLARRFRKVPGLKSSDRMDRWAEERRCFNTPIQGGARDIMAKAMVDVYNELRSNDALYEVTFTGQIHDDLRLAAPRHLAPAVSELMRRKMESAWPGFKCPLVAEPVIGRSWYDLKS